jgi:MFS family permease
VTHIPSDRGNRAVIQGDVVAVFAAKSARTFCYGFLGVLFPVYLSDLGVGTAGVGAAVSLTLAGSATLTWAIRRPAERYGTRVVLVGLGALSAAAALLLLTSSDPRLVVLAAMLGNLAVGTGETGPFLTLEQVLIARASAPARRTSLLSAYNLAGYAAAAAGAALAGALRPGRLFAIFLVGAVVQCLAYTRLGGGAPVTRPRADGRRLPSAPLIRRLAALFALDSFAGGFVLQSLVAYYLHERYGLGLEALGWVFGVTQVLTAASLLLAPRAVRRFGLLATMVVSHLVSNVVLMAIAVAPSAAVAVGLLFARHLLSQMDVPTRQAYVMAIVADHEREAAAATTNLARTVAQALTPALTGWVMQAVALAAPFVVGGGLKIVYDVLLYATFKDVKVERE